MAISTLERPSARRREPRFAREPGRVLLAMGVALLVLGAVALAMAGLTTLFSVVALGCLAILGAIFQAVFAFTSGRWEGFGLHLLLAVLYAIVGVFLVSNPLLGAMALTVGLGMLFTASGLFRIVASLEARFSGWGWPFVSGLVTTALGIYVLKSFPAASLVLLGVLFGVDMIFFGGGLIGLGAGLRRLRL